jgi:hypothetical protein
MNKLATPLTIKLAASLEQKIFVETSIQLEGQHWNPLVVGAAP